MTIKNCWYTHPIISSFLKKNQTMFQPCSACIKKHTMQIKKVCFNFHSLSRTDPLLNSSPKYIRHVARNGFHNSGMITTYVQYGKRELFSPRVKSDTRLLLDTCLLFALLSNMLRLLQLQWQQNKMSAWRWSFPHQTLTCSYGFHSRGIPPLTHFQQKDDCILFQTFKILVVYFRSVSLQDHSNPLGLL